MHILKSKRCLDVKSSTYYFHVKTKLVVDIQICTSVPLKIPEYKGLSTRLDDKQDPISNIIEKYKNRPCKNAINNTFPSHSFAFETASMD